MEGVRQVRVWGRIATLLRTVTRHPRLPEGLVLRHGGYQIIEHSKAGEFLTVSPGVVRQPPERLVTHIAESYVTLQSEAMRVTDKLQVI